MHLPRSPSPVCRLTSIQQPLAAAAAVAAAAVVYCFFSFAGTIDYIWHTPQLQVRSLLDLPSLKQVEFCQTASRATVGVFFLRTIVYLQ